jgi:hypothetical protein
VIAGEQRAEVLSLARAEARRELRVLSGKWQARRRPGTLVEEPVFLVGCPRSGTTLLFELLREHPGLSSMPDEGHVFWSAYNHPRRHDWRSDELGARDVTDREHRYLETVLASLGSGRALDKTPKNVLRLPYLREHFPRAHIVFMVRDGRSTVASLLEGWRRRRGASYLLPEPLRLRDYQSRIWRYILPPGWRDLQGRELAEVATVQYERSLDAATLNHDLIDVTVRYEDLVANPVETVESLMASLGLSVSDAVRQAAREVPHVPRGSISAPRADKWREVETDLRPYLPRIEARMERWGYA